MRACRDLLKVANRLADGSADEPQDGRLDSATLPGRKAVELNGLIQKSKREELLEAQVQRLTEKVMCRFISLDLPDGAFSRHTYLHSARQRIIFRVPTSVYINCTEECIHTHCCLYGTLYCSYALFVIGGWNPPRFSLYTVIFIFLVSVF